MGSKQALTGEFRIQSDFRRFNQKNDIFNRTIWDDKVDPGSFFTSYDLAQKFKKSKGFNQWDYALRNASWHLTDFVGEHNFEHSGKVEGFTDMYSTHTPGPEEKVDISDSILVTKRIKKVAKLFGAGLVGICNLDQRWIYSHNFNRKTHENKELDIPHHLNNVIMLAIPMDHQLGKTFPSAISGSTTGVGYMQSLGCATQLAQFITNLGFEAFASMNDTAQNIPLAILAGLGEYGRNGLLITHKFGPNVRLAKVFTDIPLECDEPTFFGVKEFCNHCRRCAESCPVKAIPAGAPQSEPPNISSHRGVTKWTVNAEKCFKFWTGMNSDCAICIRVCPYNKDYGKWWNKVGIVLASGPLRKFMLWLDKLMGFGKRMDPSHWWN